MISKEDMALEMIPEEISDALAHLLSSHVSCTGYSFPQEILDLANFELVDHGVEAYLDGNNLVKYRNVGEYEKEFNERISRHRNYNSKERYSGYEHVSYGATVTVKDGEIEKIKLGVLNATSNSQ